MSTFRSVEGESESGQGEASEGASLFDPVAESLNLPAAMDILVAAAEDDGRPGELNVHHKALDDVESFPDAVAAAMLITPTTKTELISWWLYYFAYEPISSVVLILLIPLLLQDTARRVGHVLGHPGRECSETDGPSVVCVMASIGRWHITPSAFAYYIIGLSVAAQALTFVSVGALADYGRMRKTLLGLCTWLGSACAVGFVLVYRPQMVWLAALLTIALNVFFGTASVFYNAYLPLLVQNHPKYLASQAEAQSTGNVRSRRLYRTGERLGNFISTIGIAAGYFAGILVILLVIGYFFFWGTDGMAVQTCIAGCGVWWLGFSLYSLWKLKYRPGPDLPVKERKGELSRIRYAWLYFTFSWRKLRRTMQKCRRLPTTFAFLMCYLFFSDGYSTMGSAAILIARQSMDVSIGKLTLCALIAPVAALFGTLFFLLLQRILRITNKTMLVALLCMMGCIPLYCCIGLFSERLGLRQEWEIYALTATYGTLIGAVQSFARVLFADLIPMGEESEFFSLYAVTDKGSSFLGPVVIAILSDYTNEPRYGLLFLAACIFVPVPFLLRHVGISKGKQECAQFVLDQCRMQNATADGDAKVGVGPELSVIDQ